MEKVRAQLERITANTVKPIADLTTSTNHSFQNSILDKCLQAQVKMITHNSKHHETNCSKLSSSITQNILKPKRIETVIRPVD